MTSQKPEATSRSSDGEVEAIIGRVQSERGYAVVHLCAPLESLTSEDTITFSLASWKGESAPMKGQVVLLSNIQLFAGGWRAERARPVKP